MPVLAAEGSKPFLSSAAERPPDKREIQGRHLEEGPIGGRMSDAEENPTSVLRHGPGALNPNGEGADF